MTLRELALAGAILCALSILVLLILARQRMVPALRTRPADSRPVDSKLARLLADAGLPAWANAGTYRVAQLGSIGVLALGGYVSLGLLYAIVGGLLGIFIPSSVLKLMRSRRQKRLDSDLNYLLQTMQVLLTSGSTLDAAIQQIAYHHARRNIYQSVFQQIADDIRTSGGGKQYAFERAQLTVNNATFDRFMGYLRINDQLGAELIPLLRLAQEQISAQNDMQRRLGSAAAQSKMAGYFIPLMMGGGLLTLQIMQGPTSYWGPLFTFPGNLVELFAYGMFFAGAYTINLLQQIPPAHRMFYRKGGLAG